MLVTVSTMVVASMAILGWLLFAMVMGFALVGVAMLGRLLFAVAMSVTIVGVAMFRGLLFTVVMGFVVVLVPMFGLSLVGMMFGGILGSVLVPLLFMVVGGLALCAVMVVVVCLEKVAVHLEKEQPYPRQYQGNIGSVTKAFKGFVGAPDREETQHHRECSHLAELHTHIESEDAEDKPVLPKG